MQKIETQNSTEQQPIKHKHPNQKRKKPRTSTQKTLTDQPIKHIKRIKRQTKPENGPLVPRSTNPSRSGAEIVKPMALWCQDHDFWVWVFALISRLWFLGLGFWEMGLDVWWRRRRRKNCLEKKNCLGMEDEKKKRNEGRRWSIGTWVLETRVPCGFIIRFSFASTQKSSLLDSSCYRNLSLTNLRC